MRMGIASSQNLQPALGLLALILLLRNGVVFIDKSAEHAELAADFAGFAAADIARLQHALQPVKLLLEVLHALQPASPTL